MEHLPLHHRHKLQERVASRVSLLREGKEKNPSFFPFSSHSLCGGCCFCAQRSRFSSDGSSNLQWQGPGRGPIRRHRQLDLKEGILGCIGSWKGDVGGGEGGDDEGEERCSGVGI